MANLNFGMLCSMLYNANRGKNAPARKATDFAFGEFDVPEHTTQTAEDHKEAVLAIAAAFGATHKKKEPVKKFKRPPRKERK